MSLGFEKYQGTGNDFVVIDDRQLIFPESNLPLVQKICNRKFGVGSDGLMLVRNHPEADFEMVFFNPDGSRSLCGNGSRCAVHFSRKLGMAAEIGTFTTTDGVHNYKVDPTTGIIAIGMHDVKKHSYAKGYRFIHTGSPHLIVNVDDIDHVDVLHEGVDLRRAAEFEQINGTNVNFVSEIGSGSFRVRTYERGVEAETLSCGTGVTAAAIAMALDGRATDQAEFHTQGGVLQVRFKKAGNNFTDIWLVGPVQHVFSGIFYA